MHSSRLASFHWRACLCVILLLMPAAQSATASPPDGARVAFEHIAQCLQARDAKQCRHYITAASTGIYDRFMSYGLIDCLPPEASYVSQSPEGDHVMVRAGVMNSGKTRFMRLLFAHEQGAWKLDIPASLQKSMGDSWQDQLNTTEQLYLLMRSQMGNQLNCTAIQALAHK